MAYQKGDISGDWNTIMEPESAANKENRPTWPYNNATQTESGHSFEMDDTPDRERVRLQHRSNTFIEMHPNGDEVHKIYGNGYEIVIKDKKVLVKGSCTIVIEGDAGIEVKGDAYTQVHGNLTERVNGNCNITCEKDVNISANNELKITSLEDIEIQCKSLNITGDVYVRGDIGCLQSIQSEGNITSNKYVIALQGIETLGYIHAGPTAAAHIIFPPGMIVADIDVLAIACGCSLCAACLAAGI